MIREDAMGAGARMISQPGSRETETQEFPDGDQVSFLEYDQRGNNGFHE